MAREFQIVRGGLVYRINLSPSKISAGEVIPLGEGQTDSHTTTVSSIVFAEKTRRTRFLRKNHGHCQNHGHCHRSQQPKQLYMGD